MIFQHTWKQVLDGTNTQTRRLVKPGDELVYYDAVWYASRYSQKRQDCYVAWETGKTYAVQPGRGKKAVGRIRITGIRQERVQDITTDDARAEGFFPRLARTDGYAYFPQDDYADLWDKIHTKPGETWADNPRVWVLGFELAR